MTNPPRQYRDLSRSPAWLFLGVALGSFCLLSLGANAQASRPSVHVFLQLDQNSGMLEKTLQEHLPELSVTVYGRYRDFEEGLANRRPDALLSLAAVLEQQNESPSLQGQRDGKSGESYVLASVNQALEGSLAGKTIGVVDLLGREGTQAFLSRLLKTTDMKIKRVGKLEDLLPLLEFSVADGVVLPSSMLSHWLERTQLVIKTKDVPGGPVGLTAVAVLNHGAREVVIHSFQKLDAASKRLLGIDAWSVP